MARRVGIADLKARLSKHLRSVKRGHSITVMDRDTPVATITPVTPAEGVVVRAVAAPGGLKKLKLPPPLKKKVDLDALLADERSDRF